MGGAGIRDAGEHLRPQPVRADRRLRPRPERRHHRRARRSTVAVSAFDTANIGKLQLSGGLRVENYDTEYRSMAVTGIRTDADAADTVFSGKAGVLYQFTPTCNTYVSYGTTVTPPGSGNFALSAAGQQRQQPQRRSADLAQPRARGEVGSVPRAGCRPRVALFDTRNENVIYTIDATAVPPLVQPGRRAARAGRDPRPGRPDHRSLERDGQLRLPGRQAGLAERRHRRHAADADARELRQPVDDLRRPRLHHRRRASASRTRPSSTPPTPSSCRPTTSSTRWPPTP